MKNQNMLNFADRELIFWVKPYFCVLENYVLQLKLSDQFFNDHIFLYPPPRGDRVKNFKLKFCLQFSQLIFMKSPKVSN